MRGNANLPQVRLPARQTAVRRTPARHLSIPACSRRSLVSACDKSCAMCVNHACRGFRRSISASACSTVWCIGCGMSRNASRISTSRSSSKRNRRFRQRAEIRQIRRASEAKAQHLEVAVQQWDRHKLHAHQLERTIDFVQGHARYGAEGRPAVKHVRERAPDDLERFFRAVHRHRRVLANIERPNVVEAQNVIGVTVRKQDRVQPIEVRRAAPAAENPGSCRSRRSVRCGKAARKAASGCRADPWRYTHGNGSRAKERPSTCRSREP